MAMSSAAVTTPLANRLAVIRAAAAVTLPLAGMLAAIRSGMVAGWLGKVFFMPGAFDFFDLVLIALSGRMPQVKVATGLFTFF